MNTERVIQIILSQAGFLIRFSRLGSIRVLCEVAFIKQKWTGEGVTCLQAGENVLRALIEDGYFTEFAGEL